MSESAALVVSSIRDRIRRFSSSEVMAELTVSKKTGTAGLTIAEFVEIGAATVKVTEVFRALFDGTATTGAMGISCTPVARDAAITPPWS